MASIGGKLTRHDKSTGVLDHDVIPGMEMGKPSLKVVAHLSDGRLIKGHTDAVASTDLDALLKRAAIFMPAEITIRSIDKGQTMTIPLASLKALYFVKSFEGLGQYKEIKFFEGHPPIEGLWVRMKFRDEECTEGVLRNSHHFLVDPGFLLKPPDPESNNEIVYVVKNALIEFQVLGVKHTY